MTLHEAVKYVKKDCGKTPDVVEVKNHNGVLLYVGSGQPHDYKAVKDLMVITFSDSTTTDSLGNKILKLSSIVIN